MSEQLHPGLHPDPDSLNAFIEGVLPEHARLQFLAHLGECSRCREVVFLAQEPSPASATSNPAPAWKRWFAPVPVLATGAAVCLALPAIWLYSRHTTGAQTSNMAARVIQAPPTSASPPAPNATAQSQLPKPSRTKLEPKKTAARPAPTTTPPASRGALSASTHDTTLPSLPALAGSSAPPPAAMQNSQPPTVSTLPSTLPASPESSSAEIGGQRVVAGLAGISGTVTDPTGAVISGATIKVRQLDGTITADRRTDMTGQFNVAELPAGRYELQIGAEGFRQTSRQVELQPREVASIKSQLEIGSVAETVEVTAAVPTLQTESASVSVKQSRKKSVPEGPHPLPSKLPSAITVTSGRILLALDSAGTVFVSRNAGKSWKIVKPIWPGKAHVIALADLSYTSNATFQLTTDSGSTWLSRDGVGWYPAQH